MNSSLNLDNDMLRVKFKSLRVVTVNFQSIYNKKEFEMVAIKVETSPVIFAFCYKPSKSG